MKFPSLERPLTKDSPLVIGLSKDGNFISSDISSFLNYTKEYILLEENNLAVINEKQVDIFNNNLNKVN